MVIDDDVLEVASVIVFLAHTDNIAIKLSVVFSRTYVDGRFLAGDVVERRAVLEHGRRHDIVAEIEGHTGEQQGHKGHRRYGAAHRDATGFHGHKLVFLAEVAHGHDGGEKHSDG